MAVSGKRNARWRHEVGDIWKSESSGYMRIKLGPRKNELVHRYVMEQHLGRKLSRREFVHHIDGDRANNDLSNLLIMTPEEHTIKHCKGMPSHNKGIPLSEERKRKISIARTGFKMAEETKAKISRTTKGRPSHRKGKTGIYSEETLRKKSEGMKRARALHFWSSRKRLVEV